jgi:hypothetical protein
MNLRLVASCALACAALALSGCDSGREQPGRSTVRIANVAPSFAELQFRREQVNPLTLSFKGSQDTSYDADTYDFYVLERSLVLGSPGRNWTFARELQANYGYTFVITEVGDEIVPIVLERSPASATSAQVEAVNAGANLPAVDLYLEAPGVGIAGATPRGTLAPGGQLPAQSLPAGDYEIWLTAAGNPADVLFTSATITLPAGATTTLIVTPEAGETTEELSVLFLQGSNTATLFDLNATAALRVINGATDTAPRDFAINQQFSPPLFAATPFATPTAYATIPVAYAQPINVTPVGNPGVLELDQLFSTNAGQRWTIMWSGDAGTLTHAVGLDDYRRIVNEVKIRFFNAATQFSPAVDFVLVLPGGDPTDIQAVGALFAPGVSTFIPLPPGDYDLYTRVTTTTQIVSGPTPISVAGRGLYSVLATNGPDTATATITLFEDFQ